MYRNGYCSQFDTIWGATIDGQVVTHKMGATVLRHLQTTQYLRYWRTRTRSGAWAGNTDIEGHTSACKRARKGTPNGLSCAHYNETNSRYPTFDVQHQRNHRYDPSIPEAEQPWAREAIYLWVAS